MLMGSQINELIEKYWNGETSLEEEQMIKNHFKADPSLAMEGTYFRYLNKQKEKSMKEQQVASKVKKTWISAAATVTIGLLTAFLILNDSRKDPFAEENPEQAMEVARKALLMIGAGLNEGQNHAMELTKINKVKDELQKPSDSE